MQILKILNPEEKNRLRALKDSVSVEEFLAQSVLESKNVFDVSKQFGRDGTYTTDIFVRNNDKVKKIHAETDLSGKTEVTSYTNEEL